MQSDGDSVLRTPVKDCAVSLRDISQWSVISTKEYFYREPSGENVQKYVYNLIVVIPQLPRRQQ